MGGEQGQESMYAEVGQLGVAPGRRTHLLDVQLHKV